MSTPENNQNTEVEVPNFLEMSDEEVMKMSEPPAFVAPAADTQAKTTEEKPADEAAAKAADEGGEGEGEGQGATEHQTDAGKEDATGDKTEGAATTNGDNKNTPPADGEGAKDADAAKAAKDAATEQGAAATEGDKGEKKEPNKDAPVINYEAEYKRLLAPFKANGREVQVDSVDDAINLMQMGANYNKKMAALKPNLKLMKMLENNGLLDEGKLSFLIDLDKKNPAAISKLVKDSGVDPLEIDAEKASAYKQSTAYAVDDRELELDTVLDEIKTSTTYTRTLEVVGNKWDVASKQAISQAPQLLKVIDDHMASGVYDLISTEVERQRMLGRLKGVPDLEAYRQVGDSIQARGGFNHLFQGKTPDQGKPAVQAPVVVEPKPKVDNTALNDKRKAAAPPKTAVSSSIPADFNPLAMSDEEILKMATPRFR